jgi:hypothetical protein
MRIILTILLLASFSANATTYYVSKSATASDANSGLDTAHSWLTLSKVTSFAFALHDNVWLRCNDTWIEQLTQTNVAVNFSAYGTGNMPLITGFGLVTGFTQSGNIWTATASNAVNDLNCVLLNGVFAIRARTPNTGYYTFNSSSGDSALLTNETGTPSEVGRQIVVRTAGWILDVVNVKGQSGGTLNLSPKLTTPPAGLLTNGYFYQDSIIDIDLPNEYSYTNATKSLSVYSPISPVVYAAKFDTLVKLGQGSTFENIRLTGANKLLIKLSSSCSLNNYSLQYSGWDAMQGDGISHVTLNNFSILDCWNNAITYDWIDQQHGLTVTNFEIRRIGTAAGMGRSGNGAYIGFLGFADSVVLDYGIIDSIGYNGTQTSTYPTTIQHIIATHCSITKSDGACFYTFFGAPGNIFRKILGGNNPGNTGGITGNDIAAFIYLDNNTQGQIVDSVTGYNCMFASAFVHAGFGGNTFTNNIFDDSIGIPFYNNGTPGIINKYNVYNSRSASVSSFNMDNAISQTADSNWYLRPTNPAGLILYGSAYNYNTFPLDAHGKTMPVYGDVHYPAIIVTNPTKADSTISLDQTKTYVDPKTGKFYTGSITLHPYECVLLYQSTLSIVSKVFITT